MSETTTTTESTENILVVTTSLFVELLQNGLTPTDAITLALSVPGLPAFLPRDTVETNEKYIQIISYVLLRSGNELFVYKRGTSGSENRLHEQYSIGVGGHVNTQDARTLAVRYAPHILAGTHHPTGPEDILFTACIREVHEETTAMEHVSNDGKSIRYLGAFYAPETPVSARHVAAVWCIDCDKTLLQPKESCLEDAQWVPIGDLMSQSWKEKLESWSTVALSNHADALTPERDD